MPTTAPKAAEGNRFGRAAEWSRRQAPNAANRTVAFHAATAMGLAIPRARHRVLPCATRSRQHRARKLTCSGSSPPWTQRKAAPKALRWFRTLRISRQGQNTTRTAPPMRARGACTAAKCASRAADDVMMPVAAKPHRDEAKAIDLRTVQGKITTRIRGPIASWRGFGKAPPGLGPAMMRKSSKRALRPQPNGLARSRACGRDRASPGRQGFSRGGSCMRHWVPSGSRASRPTRCRCGLPSSHRSGSGTGMPLTAPGRDCHPAAEGA